MIYKMEYKKTKNIVCTYLHTGGGGRYPGGAQSTLVLLLGTDYEKWKPVDISEA